MSYRPERTRSNTPNGALCLLAESMRIRSRPLDMRATVSASLRLASPKIG